MIDLKSGKIYPYKVKSMMELLHDDEMLFNNYNVLNKKLKKKVEYPSHFSFRAETSTDL